MIKIDDNGLFQIFPAIESIATAFEYQNSMLNKIVLTGKINALNIAENLFEFTEKTAETFAELQTNLIKNLLEENKKNIFNRAKSKAESAINILTKNLQDKVLALEPGEKKTGQSVVDQEEIIPTKKGFWKKIFG